MNERDLALALAAEAPEPDPHFARQLDERVRLGFPRDGRMARLTLARARATAIVRKRPAPALLGAAASMLLAVAIAIPLIDGDAAQQTDGQRSPAATRSVPAGPELGAMSDKAIAQSPGAEKRRADALSAGLATEPAVATPAPDADTAPGRGGAQLVAPVPPPARPGFAPGTRDRRIERSATLTLAAPDDRLDRVAANVAAVTDRHRGFVLNSSLAVGDEGATTGGQFELRIPAARLDAALADLSKLGTVRSRTTAGQDVTAAYVTAGDRLEAARAERASLLGRLTEAGSDREAAALRLRLDANAGEINRLSGRIRALRVRTNYASVAVTLQSTDSGDAAPGPAAPGPPDDGLGGALDDAADSLSGALELAIRVLGVLLPIALLAGGATLAARTFHRRRREAALSQT